MDSLSRDNHKTDRTLDLYRRDFDGNWFPDDLYFEQLVQKKVEPAKPAGLAEPRLHVARAFRGLRRPRRLRKGA